MQRKGFTLAEVLITLSIIGVVAALTIPAITASTNQTRARASVKKAVSVLNQALTMSIAQNGIGANSVTNSQALANTFAQYLSSVNRVDAATKPSITTADGITYTFYAPTDDGCVIAANNNPVTATSCVVEVDINGTSGSNVISTTTNWADLYYLVIKDSEVVPANANDTDYAVSNTNFKGNGTLDNDVAQNALLN